MKRYRALFALPAILLIGAAAQAQQRSTNPQGQAQTQQDLQRRAVRIQVDQAGQANNGLEAVRVGNPPVLSIQSVGGAWWTNPALVSRLGITDEQKTKLDRAFENHRLRLTSSTELLTKEEALLARLLEAEPIDRNAVLTQTDRVIQARSELERENSAMTLEMREALTRAQWMQVPQPNAAIRTYLSWYSSTGAPAIIAAPGPRSGGPGTPAVGGQRNGGQRQQ